MIIEHDYAYRLFLAATGLLKQQVTSLKNAPLGGT